MLQLFQCNLGLLDSLDILKLLNISQKLIELGCEDFSYREASVRSTYIEKYG